MMRAIRFSSELNFSIEKESYLSIIKNSQRLNIISKERITDELNKILLSKKPSVGLKLLFDTETITSIFSKNGKTEELIQSETTHTKTIFYIHLKLLIILEKRQVIYG